MGKQQQGVSVEQAATRLGISKWGAYKALERGDLKGLPGRGPARLDPADVERFRRARQTAALERYAAKGTDMVRLAHSTRAFMRPYPGANTGRVSAVGSDVVAAFGAAALHAAGVREGCCWCASEIAAQLLGTEPPVYGEAMLALLGKPCPKDMKRFTGVEMERLRARVHPADVRPSGARTEAAGPPAPATRPQPAQPVQNDDGKALVASRLRETRARLKDAKRRGDQAYAIRLTQIARGLEADAAVVDGRLTASARPGTLRCGHLLAAGCACPRRASKRAMS
ncbi:RodZ family helix-turn-helix domain-containing protein [Streptomyces sp. NBC_00878]|uniref:helix-turn-helix domain-containing protein n=1 Tax=Streptomyces sp. NBC_00878 TaxID=2975854 RepID=UPI00224D77DA|nr:hypothetical protein [Streptomyces sp. NBC_00878]MCX4906863.1 hypothetical protein [Streptomyces sp. NBC_00878]